MKVVITNRKAPWPAGAALGEVVEVPGAVLPGCLVGKCRAAEDEAQAQHVYEPQLPAPVLAETKVAAAAALADPDALKAAEALLAEARVEIVELHRMLERAQARIGELESAAANVASTFVSGEVTGDGTGEALPTLDAAPKVAAAKKSK
jgi:hypothetical protein